MTGFPPRHNHPLPRETAEESAQMTFSHLPVFSSFLSFSILIFPFSLRRLVYVSS